MSVMIVAYDDAFTSSVVLVWSLHSKPSLKDQHHHDHCQEDIAMPAALSNLRETLFAVVPP
jgi:hypothetical protein